MNQLIKKLKYYISGILFMAILICPAAVHAEGLDNPKLPIREPFYNEDGTIYLGEEEAGSRKASLEHWADSKKGLQENEYLLDPNYQDLGVRHVLLNMVMNSCISYENGEYHLKDASYVASYKELIPKLNAQGVTVTLVILMDWSDDPNLQQLIYSSARTPGKMFYELNTQDEVGKQAWTNIFSELVETFGQSGCEIAYYILGNEVNQTGNRGYNFTGSNDLQTNVNAHADAFSVLNTAIAEKNPEAKAFISLDHNWTAKDTGHSGKSFIDAFAAAMEARGQGDRWNVAWHAYAPSLKSDINTSMDNLVIWNSSRVTHSVDTPYISGSNVDVLTDYLRNNWGSNHRVLLSEQGYDASGSTEWQSAYFAYTFYAAQYNDMVDGVMYRAYVDNPQEGGLKFGLLDGTAAEMKAASDKAAYVEQHKRPVYDVFKYMDTDQAPAYTKGCLNTIGALYWKDLVSGYTGPDVERECGWKESGENRYYVVDGNTLKGWQTIEGKRYYLSEPYGFAATGTPIIDGAKYWFNSRGEQQKGWLYLGNWKMYFDMESGKAKTGMADIDGKRYLFNSDGVMQSYAGTPVINGKKYWFSTDDASLKSGWLYLNNWKMYFDPETYEAKTGMAEINGKRYLFNSDGVMQNYAGTPLIDGKKYWFSTDDASLKSGWLYLLDWKLYFDPETYVAKTGFAEIDGKVYLFNSDGVMQNYAGTTVINGKKYWFSTDNASLKTGWLQLGNWTLYFSPADYAAVTGKQVIDGKTYYFDENGVLQR